MQDSTSYSLAKQLSSGLAPFTALNAWLCVVMLPCLMLSDMALAKADNRQQIRIVGSSTVYPFTTVVAEMFGRSTSFKTPIVESTGTGGGMKLFCQGIYGHTADIVNASRMMKEKEKVACFGNGVRDILEVNIGFDGIVLATSSESSAANNANALQNITLVEVYQALAKQVIDENGLFIANPYKTWRDINPNFPDVEIKVYGPPATSGTRDAFVEIAMDKGCKLSSARVADLPKRARKAKCRTIREDGHFNEVGENDNLIIQKLQYNKHAVGIFGFGFMEQNQSIISPLLIDGIKPSLDSIISKDYPIARSLYVYVKLQHIDYTEGLVEFIKELISDYAIGYYGYTVRKGLIPLDEPAHIKLKDRVMQKLNRYL